VVSAAFHLSIIHQPDDLMVDEVYYVNDARGIVSGEGELRAEHPPLGQLLIACGIALFGDNTFGWRFFSMIFGLAGILFFYLICARLGMNERACLITTFFLAFENLTFVQASIAMLDVFKHGIELRPSRLFGRPAFLNRVHDDDAFSFSKFA